MLRRQDIPSPLTVRRWTTEEVLRALQQNGLGDIVQSFQKRNIDGNAFLKLTELQLTTEWNHELSLTNIRKITKLIDDINTEPDKRPPIPINKPARPVGLLISTKPETSAKPKMKPEPPPSQWKNQGRNTDKDPLPILPILGSWRDPAPDPHAGSRRPVPPTLGNRLQPTSVPSDSGSWSDPGPVTGPPAVGNRRDHSPVTVPSTFGNGRDLSPVTVPSAFGNGRDLSPVTVPSAFGNRRDLSPVTVPSAFGNRRDLSPVTVPSAFGNRQDLSPVTVPSAFGNRQDPTPGTGLPANGNRRDLCLVAVRSAARNRSDSNPVIGSRSDASPNSASSALGGPSGGLSVPPPPVPDPGKKPKPRVPLNKPQPLQRPGSNDIIRCRSPEGNGSREMANMLQRELSKAFRVRAGSLASVQNGWSTPKSAEAAGLRQAPAPPQPPTSGPLRPPGPKPMAQLPMPPFMASGQEDEHMKAIVSSIQIPSVPPKVNGVIHNKEKMFVRTSVREDGEIYEELDLAAWEAASAGGDNMPSGDLRISGIYEYIPDGRSSSEDYVQPTASVNTSTKTEFESTHVQVEELPVAPSVPARPQGGQSRFMSNLKSNLRSQIFRMAENKPMETQASKENNVSTKVDNLEVEPRKFLHSRSLSPRREKLTVSSELRKSPSSSTTSLITPNKGNVGQASSLPDQRLPPNLRPLPPTPGISSFRSGPPSNTATVSRKISHSKTSITQQPWYHNVDRRRGEEIVCNREDGTFLIRPSTQNQNPYTLTIWFGKRVYNIAIRFRSDQKFALGSEKPNEQSFRSLEDMVAYYQTEQLVLYSGGERTGQTSLKSSP